MGSLDMPCRPGRFYAYVHRRPDGQVFYVGKGTGDRACAKDHGEEHARYVAEHCAGVFSVEIVRDSVSEDDALTLEDLLMQQHAATIINRQNMHAPYDSAKMLAYSDAFGKASNARKDGERLAAEGRIDDAVVAFERAYPFYLIARDNADYHMGERRRVEEPFRFHAPFGNAYITALDKA